MDISSLFQQLTTKTFPALCAAGVSLLASSKIGKPAMLLGLGFAAITPVKVGETTLTLFSHLLESFKAPPKEVQILAAGVALVMACNVAYKAISNKKDDSTFLGATINNAALVAAAGIGIGLYCGVSFNKTALDAVTGYFAKSVNFALTARAI